MNSLGNIWKRTNGISGKWEQIFTPLEERAGQLGSASSVAAGSLGLFMLDKTGNLFYRTGTHDQEDDTGSAWER